MIRMSFMNVPEMKVSFADEAKIYEGIQYAVCYAKYYRWEDKDTLILSDDEGVLGYIYPGSLVLHGTRLLRLLISKNGFKNLLRR